MDTPIGYCAYCSDALDDDVRYFVRMGSLVEVCETCESTIKASAEPADSCSLQTDPEQDPEAGHEYTTQSAVQGEPPAIPDYDIWNARDDSDYSKRRQYGSLKFSSKIAIARSSV